MIVNTPCVSCVPNVHGRRTKKEDRLLPKLVERRSEKKKIKLTKSHGHGAVISTRNKKLEDQGSLGLNKIIMVVSNTESQSFKCT